MAENETTIKIKFVSDGKYSVEIVEPEAKSGNRADHLVAQGILKLAPYLGDPNAVRLIDQIKQNPRGALQQLIGQQVGGMFGNMFGGFNR